MDPQATAAGYDQIAQWWQTQHRASRYGIAALEKALQFVAKRGSAIDIGCGSSGRFIEILIQQGFQPEGLDISAEMIRLAQQRHSDRSFHHADVCTWTPPRQYGLITAWDSTFHLPLAQQEPVTRKLCGALEPEGVFLFSGGGGPTGSEISGTFQEQTFEYSSLGTNGFLRVIDECGCTCQHLEYDQHPLNHVYWVVQKVAVS